MSVPTSISGAEPSPWYPPRASGDSRFQRVLRAAVRWLALPSQRVLPANLTGLPAQAAVVSLVPGLGHHLLGCTRGKVLGFFLGVTGLLFWSVLFPPASGTGWMMMLAFSLHNWAMMDCYTLARARQGESPFTRTRTVVVSLVFGLVLYMAYQQAGSAAGSIGQSVVVSGREFEPAFRPGDRLLVRKQAEYRRGDIVVSGHGGIERVLALPGEQVQISGRALLVNGKPLPPEFQPLSAGMLEEGNLEGAGLTVPAGEYLILFPARTSLYQGRTQYANELLRRFVTRGGQLSGRVALRWFPRPRRFP